MAVAHTFQHVSGGERFGKKLYSNDALIEPGILVNITSGSLCTRSSGSDAPFGYAFGLRYAIYRPTSKYFPVGEAMSVVHGVGKVLASADFFIGGTLPSAGDTIYSAAGGLMDTTGTKKVAYCIRVESRIDPSGGTGTTQDVALLHFNLPVL